MRTELACGTTDRSRCAMWSVVWLAAMLASGGIAASAQGPVPIAEWDAVEAGLVSVLTRGNVSQPSIQLLSPPMPLPSDGQKATAMLLNLADTVPEWGSYFTPSGRTVRREYARIVEDAGASGLLREEIPSGEGAFRFSPDVGSQLAKGGAVVPEAKVEWSVATSQGGVSASSRSARVRVRIGRRMSRATGQIESEELSVASATGRFTAAGIGVVAIISGRWFSEPLLRKIQTQGRSPRWWEPTGNFALYPQSVVIMVDASFSLDLDARSYRAVKTALNGDVPVEIGPFHLGDSSKGSIHFDDASNRLSADIPGPSVVAIFNRLSTR